MLTVKYLTKSYDNFMLNDISFSLKEGRITGFIGMNGSGKTTVLKCILGVVPYETGKISIGGLTALQNEQEYKDKPAPELHIGRPAPIDYLVHQEPAPVVPYDLERGHAAVF